MKSLNIAKLDTLCFLLRRNLQNLNKITRNINDNYIEGVIIKKNRESRILHKPSRELKFIQNNIRKLLVEGIQLPDCVHGWVKGKSIKSAINPHKGMKYFYCFDIHSCFDSIHSKNVFTLFTKKLRCSPKVAKLFTRLSTYKSCLPQGSPCSPVITNIILFDFDISLDRYAKRRGANYTRLGDDILLSSNSKLDTLEKTIIKGLEQFGLKINKSKSKFGIPSKSGLEVLGVVLGSKLAIPKKYKRNIEAILYNSQKSGLSMQNLDGRFDFRKHLYGRITFIEMVDPMFGSALRKKLDLIKD